MFERADAFVALPGGVGTLEEVVEQMTWAQLGRHKKPILLANINGFWDPLCALLDHMAGAGVHPSGARQSTIWWPTGSRTSCRCCAAAARRRVSRERDDRPATRKPSSALVAGAAQRPSAASRNVTASMRLPSDRARRRRSSRRCIPAAGPARRRRCRRPAAPRRETHRPPRHRRAQADVDAAVGIDRRHGGPLVQPEFRILLAEADGAGARRRAAP